VLLVEDGATNRKLISLILRKAGMEVTTADNGQAAVDLARHQHFDVILMDMQMPIKDGYTATRELRNLGVTVPIVALTAHAMSGDEQKCLRAGCSGYLSKPVSAERLLQTLADVLNSREAPIAEAPANVGAPPAAAAPADRPQQPEPLAAPEEAPIVCTLPMDDPDFRAIAEEFVVFLEQQLAEISRALDEGDLAKIAVDAHTLKGTAGTAGFEAFTAPAKQLELLAKSGRKEDIPAALEVLERMAVRISIPAPVGCQENTG